MQAEVGKDDESDEGHQTKSERERGQPVGDAPPDDRARKRDGDSHAPLLPAKAALHADHPHEHLGGERR